MITTAPAMPLPDRLLTLSTELRSLVAEYRPVAVVVERVFFQVNVRTAMATGQAAGVALAAAAEAGCEVAQYTSNEVKQAVWATGAPPKTRCNAWWPRCSAWTNLLAPPMSPTPWPWPSAT